MRLELIENGKHIFAADHGAVHEHGCVWYNHHAMFAVRADADTVWAELTTTGGTDMLKNMEPQVQEFVEKYGIVCEEGVLLPEEESELQAADDKEEATEK